LLERNKNRHLQSNIHLKKLSNVVHQSSLDARLFLMSHDRSSNDRVNKLRESMLELMINAPHFQSDPLWRLVENRFTECLRSLVVIPYDDFKLVRKAGRKFNYDFELVVYRQMFIQRVLKLEFKYGKSLYQLPQIVSLYVNNQTFQIIRSGNYIMFWVKHYLKYFLQYLKHSDYDQLEYVRYINTTSSTPLKQAFTALPKQSQVKLSKLVDISIEMYLKQLTIRDINFGVIEKRLVSQVDKIFVFCDRSASFTTDTLAHIKLDQTCFKVEKHAFCRTHIKHVFQV
jgi:hypothetical protein